MRELVALLLLSWPAPRPPTDDAAACEAWVIEHSRRLANSPQPPAAALGRERPGLADFPTTVWNSLHQALPSPTLSTPQADVERRRAALEGRAPIASAPELVDVARQLEPSLNQVLDAARGSRNRLPKSLELWTTLDKESTPTFLDIQNVIRLSVTRGWVAIASKQLETAIDSCVGSLGLIRALAGNSLVGRMIATAHRRPVRALCLAVARLGTPAEREALATDLRDLRRGWPSFEHTLQEEMVFAQVAFLSEQWPESARADLPPEALYLAAAGRSQNDAASWWTRTRRAIFGRWAGREHCVQFARAVPSVGRGPVAADAALRSLADPSLSAPGRVGWGRPTDLDRTLSPHSRVGR